MRLRDLVISVFGHLALAALAFAWPVAQPSAPPRIYEVALAEWSPAPAGGAAAAVSAATPAPPAPQAAQPVPPKPAPKKAAMPKEPAPKKAAAPPAERVISTRKAQDAQAPAQEEQPEAQPAPSAHAAGAAQATPSASGANGPRGAGGPGGPGGPQLRSYGGVQAYDDNAVDERPSVLRGAMPEYPQQARRLRQEGRVLVRVVVDEQGSPVTALVQEAAPSGVFEQSALNAARRFRFLPGKIAGRSVMTAVLIPFEFRLR